MPGVVALSWGARCEIERRSYSVPIIVTASFDVGGGSQSELKSEFANYSRSQFHEVARSW